MSENGAMTRVFALPLAALGLLLGVTARADFPQALAAYQAGDYSAAAAELSRLADVDPQAQGLLAQLYFHGQGVEADQSKARELFRASAESGIADSQTWLGMMLMNGQGGKQDLEEAVLWFEKAADQGEVVATHNLALAFHQGQGVARDYSRALSLYRTAAETGYAWSQYNLYSMHLEGQGVDPDHKIAEFWLRAAAARDFADAQFALAQRLEPETSEIQDPVADWVASRWWYEKSAMQGNLAAQVRLGELELEGSGGPRAPERGLHWLERAAGAGSGEAMLRLGTIYDQGWPGIKVDLVRARNWYFAAAKRGSAAACAGLSAIFLEGKGVPEDRLSGLVWLRLANIAASRSGSFTELLATSLKWESWKAMLSEEDVALVEKSAEEWAKSNW